MLEPLNFELGGESYQLLPHTGFAALDLDRKVTALMGRIVGNAGADSADFPNRIFVALGSALSEYSPSEYRDIVESTLSRVSGNSTASPLSHNPGRNQGRLEPELGKRDRTGVHCRGRRRFRKDGRNRYSDRPRQRLRANLGSCGAWGDSRRHRQELDF